MIGIGIDLCEIARMERVLQQKRGFLTRYFTPEEQAYILARGKMGAQSLAAMFAAKEALLKALGVGLSGGISMQEIQVLHEDTGRPLLQLHGKATEKLAALGGQKIHVSLCHEAGMAAAVVVLE